jgi:8-oxo-dGTP diphosphatase
LHSKKHQLLKNFNYIFSPEKNLNPMTERCQGYTSPAPRRCKNKASPIFCAKHCSSSSSTIEPAVLDLVHTKPVYLPAQPPLPLPTVANGTYEIKQKLYERYQVQFRGPLETTQKDGSLGSKFVYNFPMAALTVDLVVFDPSMTRVLLIQRGPDTEPKIYANKWAVPGGFMEPNENATEAAIREFNEEVSPEVHIDPATLYHVYTASGVGRDVRQRTVSVVFTTILPLDVKGNPVDIKEISKWKWHALDTVWGTELSFDHKHLIARAYATQKVMQQLDPATRQLLQQLSTDVEHSDANKRKTPVGPK